MEANRAFAEKFDFPFALLCDTDRSLAKAYGAYDDQKPGAPRRISYLIDAGGKIQQAWAKVIPDRHPGEVLAALNG